MNGEELKDALGWEKNEKIQGFVDKVLGDQSLKMATAGGNLLKAMALEPSPSPSYWRSRVDNNDANVQKIEKQVDEYIKNVFGSEFQSSSDQSEKIDLFKDQLIRDLKCLYCHYKEESDKKAKHNEGAVSMKVDLSEKSSQLYSEKVKQGIAKTLHLATQQIFVKNCVSSLDDGLHRIIVDKANNPESSASKLCANFCAMIQKTMDQSKAVTGRPIRV